MMDESQKSDNEEIEEEGSISDEEKAVLDNLAAAIR